MSLKAVLFIEDDKIERDLIKFEVVDQKMRFNPVFSASAEDGITYLKSCEAGNHLFPSIIVVDIHLSGKSGDEFLEDYSKLFMPHHASTKVFFLSNSFMLPDEQEMERYSCLKGAFEKPFSKEMYEEMLKR